MAGRRRTSLRRGPVGRVLFAGDDLEARFLAALDEVPAGTPALPTVFKVAPQVLRPRDFLLERAAVIAANPPLLERELIKMASLSETVAEALVRHGFDRRTARLATESAAAVLRQATARWPTDDLLTVANAQ